VSAKTDRSTEVISTKIERFDKARHDVSRFSCGKAALDTYIHETVGRDEAHHTAVTYVLVDAGEPANACRVIGYFTLNTYAFSRKQARRRDRDKYLGNYEPVSAILIGRLALDSEFHHQGLGSVLIVSALDRVLTIRESIGVAVVVVHALDEEAAAFYEHQGFTRFRDEPNHLYYPLATFEAAIAAS
jgi:GNAT superfamily N-acetyltransferase